MTIICVFDTETTGLLPKGAPINKNTYNVYPHIVQMSWIMYDLDSNKIVKTIDHIVKCPVVIQNSHIHGITNEISNDGKDVEKVMRDFIQDVIESDLLVCHNFAFDSKIVEVAMYRLGMFKEIKLFKGTSCHCTMLSTVKLCELQGRYVALKWPTLQELHFKLFGKKFDNCHNSLADTQATLRCYMKYERGISIL